MKESSSASILSKYGGEKYLERQPRELLGGQTEDYVEYSRSGAVIKGQARAKAKSKYEEDGVLIYLFSLSLDSDTNVPFFDSFPWKSFVSLGIILRW
jgi:hypothetical protein